MRRLSIDGGIGVSFAGQNLRGLVLRGSFVSCTFRGAILHSADLRGTFVDCNFEGADLEEAVLRGSFTRCTFLEIAYSAKLHGRFASCRGL